MGDAFAATEEILEDPETTDAALSRSIQSVLPVTGVSVSTVGELLGSETISASDELAERIDMLQFDLGEGPCWDAHRTGQRILVGDLAALPASRWPLFVEAIRADGVHSIFAFPIVFGPFRLGAVDLYATRPVTLDDETTGRAQVFSDIIGRRIIRNATHGADDTTTRPFSRRTIHQATGIVIAQLGLTAKDAYLLIQGHAFAQHRSMLEVSDDLLTGRLHFTRGSDGIAARERT